MSEDPKYHQAPHTLDPNREIPEDAPPSAGHDDEQAENVRAADEAFTEGVGEASEEEVGAREPGDHASESDDSDDEEGDSPPDGTIEEVLSWVGDDPDRAATALQAEREGKQRATLISELEARQ